MSPRIGFFMCITGISLAAAADEIRTVREVPAAPGNTLYVGNRAPLVPSPLMKLPIGASRPRAGCGTCWNWKPRA